MDGRWREWGGDIAISQSECRGGNAGFHGNTSSSSVNSLSLLLAPQIFDSLPAVDQVPPAYLAVKSFLESQWQQQYPDEECTFTFDVQAKVGCEMFFALSVRMCIFPRALVVSLFRFRILIAS